MPDRPEVNAAILAASARYRAEVDAALAEAEARYRAFRNDPEATADEVQAAAENLQLAAEAAEPEWDDQDSAAWCAKVERLGADSGDSTSWTSALGQHGPEAETQA